MPTDTVTATPTESTFTSPLPTPVEAATLNVDADPVMLVAGSSTVSQIGVEVLDKAGKPIPALPITFQSSLGSVDPVAVTNQYGVAVAHFSPGSEIGVVTITISASNLQATMVMTLTTGSTTQVAPQAESTLIFTSEGAEVALQIPSGAVTADTTLAYVDLNPVQNTKTDQQFAGLHFYLDAFQSGAYQSDFTFNLPIELLFSLRGIRSSQTEGYTLILGIWDGNRWVNSETDCNQRFIATTVTPPRFPICRAGEFALLEVPAHHIFLPTVTR